MVAGVVALKVNRYSTVLCVLLLVSGCVPPDFKTSDPPPRTAIPEARPPAVAVIHPVPEPPPPPAGSVDPSLPSRGGPPSRTAPPASPATQALLTQSRGHQAAGRYEQAAASIERALRIEPRQPLLWLELGTIRLKEGDFAQAEGMGRKALSLSAGDAALTARAEQLIGTAKNR